MNLKLNEICSPHGPHEPLLSKLIGSMKYKKQIGPKCCSIHYNPTVCITISLKPKHPNWHEKARKMLIFRAT